jgi:hypothetical protein
MRRRRHTCSSLVGLLATLVLTGCADREPNYCGGGASLFPGDSLQDWKSYADYLALFTVVGVNEPSKGAGQPPPLPTVTLRIDGVLWSAQGAPALPIRITMQPAWTYDVGQQFLAPLVRIEKPREWWPVTACAPMPVHKGRVSAGRGSEREGPLHARLDGQTVRQLVVAFRRQAPDPLAERYNHLRPQARVQKVFATRD